MTEESILQEDILESNITKAVDITAFTVIDNNDGIQIKIGNCVKLHISPGLPDNIIGTIKIEGQIVPVTYPKGKKEIDTQDIDDNFCVILQQRKEGKHTITTGALYEDVSAVLEIIRKKL